MGYYKKVKFPFEVTKGKAQDLYQLRFMRKSELEPIVRHNLRHSVGQMGRQLDLWFKEQLFTIGYLNKAQEKVHQSRKRLKIEVRKSKKREYARRQDEIRTKLMDIRRKMLVLKVIQKFKENVNVARSYRNAETSLKGNVDVLRVSGNKQLIHGTEEKQKSYHESQKNEKSCNCSNRDGNHSTSDCGKANKQSPRGSNPANEGGDSVVKTKYTDVDYDSNHSDDDEEEGYYHGDSDQRRMSSHGPRMETIPEETEEVDVEIESYKELPRLTKTQLSLLDRSQSKRNIFDVNDSVPLLPDVTGHMTQVTSTMRRHLPDTADKETQTSEKSKSSHKKKTSVLRRKAAEKAESNGKKTIVIKLPHSKFQTTQERENSVKSNSGHYGSDDSDDDYNDATTDTDFAYGFESDLITSETDEYVEHSDDENDTEDESHVNGLSLPDEFSFTLTKYKTTLRRKAENNPTSRSFPTVTNIDTNFSDITSLRVQNPHYIRYKERSFYTKPFSCERLTGSASQDGKARAHCASNDKPTPNPRHDNVNALNDIKRNKSEDGAGLKSLMDGNQKQKMEKPNIAVYGRKPSGVSGPQFPSPPNSPVPTPVQTGLSPRRVPPRPKHTSSLYTKKRANTEREERIHEIVSNEPVQKYERTRSGKIRPFGTPRIPSHEIPSLREQYYRDKLLKAERDSILKQNIKMKRFIGTFDKGGDFTKLPTMPGGEDARTEADSTTASPSRPRKSLGNILFKVHQPEQDVEFRRKVVPGVSTTSLHLLKNCRYLREYKPMADHDNLDKETSWGFVKARSESSMYLANVRVSLI